MNSYNKTALFLLFTFFGQMLPAQVVKDYDPAKQRTTHLQYFKPAEPHLFAGDGMPYFHNGTFYLYWLLDEGHHAGLGGLGGHQWALSTSDDLINWKHYPVALGIDDESWEKSICTGSVIEEKGLFYAFYSTRVRDDDGHVHEQLSYAISDDGGKTYQKQQPNPFYFAPDECISREFRDPKVFKDKDGLFHLFISGYMKEGPIRGNGGYLVHLTSSDLKNWKEDIPPLKGQITTPECSDYFQWGDWYYLVYSLHGYTFYLKSRQPYGPWEYPNSQPLSEYWGVVYKTAEFKNNRRIAVAYTPERKDNVDDGERIWGGNVLFRELTQATDGELYLKFLPETMPNMETAARTVNDFQLDARANTLVELVSGLPENYLLTMEVEPVGNYKEMGVFLRGTDSNDPGYKMAFCPDEQQLFMQNTSMYGIKGLHQSFKVEILVKEQFIDICINGQRCMLNRFPGYATKGNNIYFYATNGNIKIKNTQIRKVAD